MVECQLPKLNTGVRFPSPAPKNKIPESIQPEWIPGFSFSGAEEKRMWEKSRLFPRSYCSFGIRII